MGCELRLVLVLLLALFGFVPVVQSTCTWTSEATGTHYDLRPLQVGADSSDQCFKIEDGDIPCTPEIEPSYAYVWNFCADVNRASMPPQCSTQGKTGVVMQYSPNTGDNMCYIISHFDEKQHVLEYSLIDKSDPTMGISVQYPSGETCTGGVRSASVDVLCANHQGVVVSAEEPSHCHYHMVMRSYYGCPTECPVTGNGLCDSHGHCAMDTTRNIPYCFCNEGYYGDSCSSQSAPKQESYDGYSVQVGFLVVLLIVAATLTGGLVYMGYQVMEFRKEQIGNHYKNLAGGENEMVETLDFRR